VVVVDIEDVKPSVDVMERDALDGGDRDGVIEAVAVWASDEVICSVPDWVRVVDSTMVCVNVRR
jgi:hypothetical protein